jgi:hypothetical protein
LIRLFAAVSPHCRHDARGASLRQMEVSLGRTHDTARVVQVALSSDP